jgi:hypothetical protein
VVSNEMVVWMSYPESSRSLISVENTPRSFDGDDQVVFEIVVCLNCVFNKDVMTFSFVNYIVFNPKMMDAMHCYSSVDTLVDSQTFNVGVVYCSDHMEMNGIPTEFFSLTDICQLYVGESGSERVIALGMKEDSCSVLISFGSLIITSEDDVS